MAANNNCSINNSARFSTSPWGFFSESGRLISAITLAYEVSEVLYCEKGASFAQGCLSGASGVGFHRFRCTQCNLYFEGFSLFPSRQKSNGNVAEDAPALRVEDRKAKMKMMAKEEITRMGNSKGQACPSCHGTQIRRSKRVGTAETLLYPIISKFPFRCNECGFRFYCRSRS